MRKSQFSKALTIALPPEQYEQIKQITDDQQISMAEWVRDAVNASLERYQSQTDAIDDK
jgi:predicted transcriptional regulator